MLRNRSTFWINKQDASVAHSWNVSTFVTSELHSWQSYSHFGLRCILVMLTMLWALYNFGPYLDRLFCISPFGVNPSSQLHEAWCCWMAPSLMGLKVFEIRS